MWETNRTLKVPTGALFRHGKDWACLVFSDGTARRRVVRVGRSNGVEAELLEGAQEGERLILYPGDRIRDGQRIRIMEL